MGTTIESTRIFVHLQLCEGYIYCWRHLQYTFVRPEGDAGAATRLTTYVQKTWRVLLDRSILILGVKFLPFWHWISDSTTGMFKVNKFFLWFLSLLSTTEVWETTRLGVWKDGVRYSGSGTPIRIIQVNKIVRQTSSTSLGLGEGESPCGFINKVGVSYEMETPQIPLSKDDRIDTSQIPLTIRRHSRG